MFFRTEPLLVTTRPTTIIKPVVNIYLTEGIQLYAIVYYLQLDQVYTIAHSPVVYEMLEELLEFN